MSALQSQYDATVRAAEELAAALDVELASYSPAGSDAHAVPLVLDAARKAARRAIVELRECGDLHRMRLGRYV